MAEYIDSASGDPSEFLGYWLERNLIPSVYGFRAQIGYFRFPAIAPFAKALAAAARAGHPVHFVIGSNQGSLVAADAQRVLRIVNGPNTSLTIVAFAAAEFHPKVFHVTRQDSSTTAAVGSSNLTPNGLGLNVEASLTLDSKDHDSPTALKKIAQAIDRWHELEGDGVFHIQTDADLQALVNSRIINLPQPPRPVFAAASRARKGTTVGRRQRAWTPDQSNAPIVPALIPPPPEVAAPIIPTTTATGVPDPGTPHAIITRQWCKELRSSDAQHVREGTNPTGKLRLTESGFSIRHETWFRADFFGSVRWAREMRNGNVYEVAQVPFDVTIRGRALGQLILTVDHAPHRVAAQSNVPTILAWGRVIMRELTRANYVGDWVVLTRNVAGAFALTIQRKKPHWAP